MRPGPSLVSARLDPSLPGSALCLRQSGGMGRGPHLRSGASTASGVSLRMLSRPIAALHACVRAENANQARLLCWGGPMREAKHRRSAKAGCAPARCSRTSHLEECTWRCTPALPSPRPRRASRTIGAPIPGTCTRDASGGRRAGGKALGRVSGASRDAGDDWWRAAAEKLVAFRGRVHGADDAWHETQATSMTSPPPLRP